MRFDLSNRNLQKITSDVLQANLEFLSSSHEHDNDNDDNIINEQTIETALFDNNSLSKLDSLDKFSNLKHVIDLEDH